MRAILFLLTKGVRELHVNQIGNNFTALPKAVTHVDNAFALNPWAELVKTTSKVILQIAVEFRGDFHEGKRVISLNSWVEYVQTISTVLPHILSLFARDFKLFLNNSNHEFFIKTLAFS